VLPDVVAGRGAVETGSDVSRRPGGSDVIVGVVGWRRVVAAVGIAARLLVVEVTQCIRLHRRSTCTHADRDDGWMRWMVDLLAL